MKKVAFALITGLAFSATAYAEESSHKLFAGTFTDAGELKKIIKDGDHQTRSSTTVIPCTPGTQFGTAYMLQINQTMQKDSRNQAFTETWSYPESTEYDAAVVSREVVGKFKRQRSNPLFSGSAMPDGVAEDSEFHVEVSKDGNTYLAHTFLAKGCTEDTMPELQAALAAGDPDRLFCEMQEQTGTRLKRRVCMTAEEKELQRDLLEMEMRNSSG